MRLLDKAQPVDNFARFGNSRGPKFMAVRRSPPWKWHMWLALVSGVVTGYALWLAVARLLH